MNFLNLSCTKLREDLVTRQHTAILILNRLGLHLDLHELLASLKLHLKVRQEQAVLLNQVNVVWHLDYVGVLQVFQILPRLLELMILILLHQHAVVPHY